jgi:hypothetical protein
VTAFAFFDERTILPTVADADISFGTAVTDALVGVGEIDDEKAVSHKGSNESAVGA